MGLLEEAIREHLDLKRQHGADPNELARAEREALGPVGAVAPAASDAGSSVATDEDRPATPAEREPRLPPDPSTQARPGAAVERPAEGSLTTEAAPPPAHPPADAIASSPSAASQHTTVPSPSVGEVDWEPLPESQKPSEPTAADDEDLLEETPEFLAEAPEHDRLWFEQRPARDFDFDE